MSDLPRYVYQPLDPQHIRVAELHPGQPDAPIVCNIIAQRPDEAPYEAVSYVWGNPAPPAFIRVAGINGADEHALAITGNLYKSLLGLRLPHEKRRLWTDAICINQASTAERQSQVRLMGSVYSQAQRSLCWIGYFDDHEEETSVTARLAMRFTESYNSDPDGYLQATRRLFHSHGKVDDADEALRKSWQAIKALFDLEYFHRVWIIQEIGLARHAQMLWGSEDIRLDWTQLATFASHLDFNAASVVNHLQLKSWVADHVSFVWSTNADGSPVYSFVEVLHWARTHRATDPRDHVYGLLSHPSARVDGRLLIEPDYTISIADAYIEVASSLVERTHSLFLLAFVDHYDEPNVLALPTWVPDWHAKNIVAPLRFPTHAAPDTCNSMSLSHFTGGVILECRGFLVDRLSTLSDMITPSELTVTNLQHELQKSTPFLIDHIWEKVVVQAEAPPMSPSEFIASLSLVFTGGYWNDQESISGDRQDQQQADCAAFIFECERIRVEEHPSKFLASLSHDEKSRVHAMADRGSAHQFVQDVTWNSMCRRLFRTTKGRLGIGPHIMKRDDCCVVLSGSRYPVLLRQTDKGFELVGPTLLDGYMDGEAQELCRTGKLSEQVFKIF